MSASPSPPSSSPTPSSPPPASSQPAPLTGQLQRYRQHRELLLCEVVAFVDGLRKIETRLVAEFKTAGWQAVAEGQRRSLEPGLADALLPLQQRTALERTVDSDDEAVAFERAWRVLLVAPPQPELGLSFVDDFFLEPFVSADDPHHRRRGKAWPGRFVSVDREAGRNAIEDALRKQLKNRPKGEVSRLPSKPPFELQPGRDHVPEDIAIVRTCANGTMPDDYDVVIVEKVYESVARRAGWKRGKRLRNFAPTDAAAEWNRLARHVRQRWKKLERVLGPFQNG